MATIIKGKNKGKEVKVCQFCNDWFSVDLEGMPLIVSPTMLQLTKEEMKIFHKADRGHMDMLFTLLIDGTFKRRAK